MTASYFKMYFIEFNFYSNYRLVLNCSSDIILKEKPINDVS